MTGPHSERGHYTSGYWATANEAKNLSSEHIEQLLRIEEAAIANQRRMLAWYEGRSVGLRNELANRREDAQLHPRGRHAIGGPG